jgi:large subunit ribosomal protein L28
MLRRCLSSSLSSAARWQQGALSTTTSLPAFSPLPNNNHQNTTITCRYRSNRSRRGLYDGKDIRSGNNVSFSMKATKRKFKPNVFIKRVYSEILKEMIRFHLTTSSLRSIDKAGGLDNYLLTSKHVTSGEGMVVKERIVQQLKWEERQKERTSESEEEPLTATTTL